MKTLKLLFATLTLGSILTIDGYSVGNYGRGFSAPATYQHPKVAETRPKPAQKEQADADLTKKQITKGKPSSEESKTENEARALY